MNVLLSAVSVLAIGYAALAAALYFYQHNLLYLPDMPTRAIEATPRDIDLEFESVALETRDGERLDAWYIPAAPARGVLLFCHGNAGNISHRLDSIRLFHGLGLSVLIFDYRGFGQSSGRPTENGTYRDVDAAWRYLVEQRALPPGRIILFGRSLGAAVAADLAAREQGAAVILESAFASIPDVAAGYYPWLPVRWLSRYRYDNLQKVANIRSPVLIVHSRDDEIIPFANGERLFEAANEPKQFLELRGGHNDGHMVSGQAYIQGLNALLDRVLDGT